MDNANLEGIGDTLDNQGSNLDTVYMSINEQLPAADLQARTSVWQTAWRHFKTVGKVLGGLVVVTAAVAGAVIGIKAAVGSKENSGNSDNSLETVRPSSLQKTGEAKTLAPSCGNPGTQFLNSAYGSCKFDQVGESLEQIDADIKDLKNALETAGEASKGHGEKIESLATDLSGIKTRLTTAESSINTQGTDIGDLKLENSEFATKIADLETKNDLLEEGDKALKAEIDQLVLTDENLQQQIEDLRNESGITNQELQDKINALVLEDKTLKENIKALKNRDSELEEKIIQTKAELEDKVETLSKENLELKTLLKSFAIRLEALEKAGTPEEVTDRLNSFGEALNGVASAIVGKDIKVVDDIPVTEPKQSRGASNTLRGATAEDITNKALKSSSEGLDLVSAKIGGMDSRAKWAIGGAVGASILGVLLVADIVANIYVKKRIGDGQVGPITKFFQNFFGEIHTHFNKSKIHRDALQCIAKAVEQFAIDRGLYDEKTKAMTNEQEEEFKACINQAIMIFLYMAKISIENAKTYKEVAQALVAGIGSNKKEQEDNLLLSDNNYTDLDTLPSPQQHSKVLVFNQATGRSNPRTLKENNNTTTLDSSSDESDTSVEEEVAHRQAQSFTVKQSYSRPQVLDRTVKKAESNRHGEL